MVGGADRVAEAIPRVEESGYVVRSAKLPSTHCKKDTPRSHHEVAEDPSRPPIAEIDDGQREDQQVGESAAALQPHPGRRVRPQSGNAYPDAVAAEQEEGTEGKLPRAARIRDQQGDDETEDSQSQTGRQPLMGDETARRVNQPQPDSK